MPTFGLTEFFNHWRIRDFEMRLQDTTRISRDGSGQILRSANGARLWVGQVGLIGGSREIEALDAVMDSLTQPGYDFIIRHPYVRYPADDPDGSGLSGFSPVVGSALPAAPSGIRLAGLPVGYTVSAGDRFSVEDNGRHALFRTRTGGNATSAGTLLLQDIAPWRPAWVDTGQTVHLIDARMKAIIAPGIQMGRIGPSGRFNGASFSFSQTLA